MPVPSKANQSLTEDQQHYSTVLCELWSGYIKFLHVGMAAAGFTVVAVGQYVSGISDSEGHLGYFVKASVLLAGLAGVSFALCRWLSQVIMERQVYGPRAAAEAYFTDSETRPPNALWYSARTLRAFYWVNDKFKMIGAASLLISWVAIVYVLFRQVDVVIVPRPI